MLLPFRMDIALVLFLLSVFVVVYVLVGYPLLLALTPTRKPMRADIPKIWPRVSIILPVRNGERWIRSKLESLLALEYPHELLDIIVISDNSTDGTEAIVREFSPRVSLYQNPQSGKAAALNEGLAHAQGEILFFTDVRQAIDRQALKVLVASFDDPRVGVASGELIIRKGHSLEEHNTGLYWRYEKWIRRRHTAIDSMMGATGAIYAMRRSLARAMPPDTLLDDVYLPLAAFFQGYRIILVEEARAYDYPTSLNAEFQRKVRTQAGVYQLIGNYPELLGPRNRMWLHFLSHKVGRLALPFALASLLLSSIFLSPPWSSIALMSQIVFYALAMLDALVPENSPVKRITSLVRTFVVMVFAAFCAISILFRPAQSLWKAPTRA